LAERGNIGRSGQFRITNMLEKIVGFLFKEKIVLNLGVQSDGVARTTVCKFSNKIQSSQMIAYFEVLNFWELFNI